MKKIWTLIFALSCVLLLSACSGNTTGGNHVHKYGDWQPFRPQTCTVEEVMSRTCACGDIQYQVTKEPRGHNYIEGGICLDCGRKLTMGMEYEENRQGGYTLVAVGNYKGGQITIPETHNGKPVTAIGAQAFKSDYIRYVSIPFSVRDIHPQAFVMCRGLQEIYVEANNPYYYAHNGVLFNKDSTLLLAYPADRADVSYSLPGTVQEIGDYAFFESKNLLRMRIHGTVKQIGSFAFYGSSIESIGMMTGVNRIGDYAFSGCSQLTNVVLPGTITYIGKMVFADNTNLEEITYNASSGSWERLKKHEQWLDLPYLAVMCSDGMVEIEPEI